LHFDKKGFLLEEFSPFSGGLPAHYATRRPNRGMEGLTVNWDGQTLTGIMQSPLAGAENFQPLSVRIISINLADKSVREYFYPLSDKKTMVSEIFFLNENEYLVLERDGDFPHNGRSFKKIFKINTSQAGNDGVLKKELYLDILTAISGYPHDKPEGIFLINKHTLCIVNDDDFGINAPETPDGTIIPKLAPDGSLDVNVMYFVEMGE
jgi:hypothetical protein